jgi:hypothetical protein
VLKIVENMYAFTIEVSEGVCLRKNSLEHSRRL